MSSTTLIQGGFVLTMDERETVHSPGAVLVRGADIIWVGPPDGAPLVPDEVLDYPHGVILPGLVNAHTHVAMTLFRGLADDLPLDVWLNDHIFPAESRLTGDMVDAGSRLGAAEMLLSGTTCLGDMYLFTKDVARALGEVGIRAVVGEVLYDFPSASYGELPQGYEYTQGLIDEWQDHPLISVAVEPHAVYTCSPELLQNAHRLAADNDVRLIIHLSETQKEVRDCLAKFGRTPVGHLENLGLLSDRLLVDHCVWVTPEEIELLARRRVNVAHCPESNHKLGSGIAPIADMLAAGLTVGIGTDGPTSNNDLDLFSEMQAAALIAKGFSLDPTKLPAGQVLAMATRGGAAALGLFDQIGSLEVGKRADLIVVDTDRPHLTPMYDPVSHLVYAARGSDVVLTMVHGRVLARDSHLTSLDIEEVKARVRRIARQIRPN
ncbi:MAG: amidohydrolase [Proteobacteria bacterium]|nr:amidohydrolase [Pseudomonadota bacterium]MBU1740003.1 amidohydrolase [Pseudomonadota bacterium]